MYNCTYIHVFNIFTISISEQLFGGPFGLVPISFTRITVAFRQPQYSAKKCVFPELSGISRLDSDNGWGSRVMVPTTRQMEKERGKHKRSLIKRKNTASGTCRPYSWFFCRLYFFGREIQDKKPVHQLKCSNWEITTALCMRKY